TLENRGNLHYVGAVRPDIGLVKGVVATMTRIATTPPPRAVAALQWTHDPNRKPYYSRSGRERAIDHAPHRAVDTVGGVCSRLFCLGRTVVLRLGQLRPATGANP